MSTRCQIKVITDDESTSTVYLYKHSDGYPEDVIPTLAPFVERFIKNRGFDESYLLAQIMRNFAARDFEKAQNICNCDVKDEMRKKGNNFLYDQDYLGWGIDTVQHGDISYLYEIDSTGSIFVNGKKLTDLEKQKYINNAKG